MARCCEYSYDRTMTLRVAARFPPESLSVITGVPIGSTQSKAVIKETRFREGIVMMMDRARIRLMAVAVFITVTTLAASDEAWIGDRWTRERFAGVDITTGEIEWTHVDDIVFLDSEWARIETTERRVEEKYQRIEDVLVIGTEEYIIIDEDSEQIEMIGVWDLVGDMRISVGNYYRLTRQTQE